MSALLGTLALSLMAGCSANAIAQNEPSGSGGAAGAQNAEALTLGLGGEGSVPDLGAGDVAELGRNFEITDIEYSEGLFVAVGAVSRELYDQGRSTSYVVSSTDGKRWDQRYLSEDVLLHSVATHGERWLSVGWTIWDTDAGFQRAVGILSSDDGLVWVPAQEPDVETLADVVWTGSQFVLAGTRNRATVIFTSDDGEVWAEREVPDLSEAAPHLVAHDGVVIVGAYGLAYSLDHGLSWSGVESLRDGARVSGLWLDQSGFAGACSLDPLFGEYPGSREDIMLASVDGKTWTETAAEGGLFFPTETLAWSEDTQVGIGYAGRGIANAGLASKASNGNWVDGPPGLGSDVVYGEGVFVAAGSRGLKWSTDGVSWEDAVISPEL